MKKRNVWMTAGALALSACMAVWLTACGSTISEAKRLRGDEVTAEEWEEALSAVSLTAGTARAADAEDALISAVPPPNFSVKYEAKNTDSIVLEKSDATSEAKFSLDVQTSVSVEDRNIHIEMKYDVSLDGSEDVVKALETMTDGEELSAKGELEAYLSFAGNAVAVYLQTDGGWKKYSSVEDASGISSAVLGQLEACVSLMDCSGYAAMFSAFEYDDAAKGYALKGGVEGGDMFGVEASFVVKVKDGKLAAVLSEGVGETEIALLGLTVASEAETGLVYKFGGQSVTLPKV